METFEGTRALITGGASGIGLGLATALLERGAAAVALLDVDRDPLDAAVARLATDGAQVLGIVADVTDQEAIDAAVTRAWDELGGLDVVCLNAGVFAGGRAWETTADDFEWVMSVNLRGVANGMRAVVPRLIAADGPSHVLVTASIAGVVAAPVSAPYVASKFAALGLTECLHHDLTLMGIDHVGVSAICPAMVSTNIGDSDRNRPAALPDATTGDAVDLAAAGIADAMATGLDPVVGARNVLDQVSAGRFYVSTHPVEVWERLTGAQNDDRLAGRAPRLQLFD